MNFKIICKILENEHESSNTVGVAVTPAVEKEVTEDVGVNNNLVAS